MHEKEARVVDVLYTWWDTWPLAGVHLAAWLSGPLPLTRSLEQSNSVVRHSIILLFLSSALVTFSWHYCNCELHVGWSRRRHPPPPSWLVNVNRVGPPALAQGGA